MPLHGARYSDVIIASFLTVPMLGARCIVVHKIEAAEISGRDL
jgi:hypothetical protein